MTVVAFEVVIVVIVIVGVVVIFAIVIGVAAGLTIIIAVEAIMGVIVVNVIMTVATLRHCRGHHYQSCCRSSHCRCRCQRRRRHHCRCRQRQRPNNPKDPSGPRVSLSCSQEIVFGIRIEKKLIWPVSDFILRSLLLDFECLTADLCNLNFNLINTV